MDDSALSLNTGSEAEAIQAHHSFWLFPPDSQDLKRGWEAKSHPGQVACHPAPRHQRTACACWCHHLKGAGHFRTARLAALPPQQDTKGPRLTGFTPPYPRKNTDPFHLTNVRRGLGKPQVRVPAPQCPS